MNDFFTVGFWANLALIGMVLFLLFGLDLLFGAKLMARLNRSVNKKFHVDKVLINAFDELKKATDREFDVESSILRGWGRFVMSGLLIFGAMLLFLNVLPSLK